MKRSFVKYQQSASPVQVIGRASTSAAILVVMLVGLLASAVLPGVLGAPPMKNQTAERPASQPNLSPGSYDLSVPLPTQEQPRAEVSCLPSFPSLQFHRGRDQGFFAPSTGTQRGLSNDSSPVGESSCVLWNQCLKVFSMPF